MKIQIQRFYSLEYFFINLDLTIFLDDELVGEFHINGNRCPHPGMGLDLRNCDALAGVHL